MSTNILTGIIFVVVFGIVVLVHEIGHFAVGKFFKVKIEEFGIGLPPKMLTLFTWKETDFTINWLPLGGFNRFSGEGDPDIKGGLANASPGVRIAVLLAGSTMNFILGILVYTFIISQIGFPDFSKVIVGEVTPDSPAAEAGFRENDIFLEINSEAINSDAELRAIILENVDEEIDFTLQRGEEIIETSATPLSSRSVEEGAMGFLPSYTYVESPSILSSFAYGTQITFLHAREILLLPVKIISGAQEERVLGGLFSVARAVRETLGADIESREEIAQLPASSSEPTPLPTFYTWELIASLTITLGVFNLLPFPALDGGRIFFIIPELIFRKRVPANFENLVHGIGMMLLLGFMLYINVLDIVNPIDIILPK
ncbi:MAG: site-2 protease family protein [Anaerolineae bacterium]|jgi:regulator of sigma E protease|nr:site-2 protease family protein [Anaerolineae bacterium]MBT7075975.1 site-2 protease family protein [Anaerolineae bacterium]MBT7783818.1 site-2 protease family protein [Anaerolineae bacterium]